MKNKTLFAFGLMLAVFISGYASASDNRSAQITKNTPVQLIFALSDAVTMERVFYENRYGITIAALLFLPSDIDTSAKYSAVVIGPPFGGVKEQGPSVYAQELAKRGFVAVAFDQSYNGESSGNPRNLFSWDFFSEDYSAGVDFLGSLSLLWTKIESVPLESAEVVALF